MKRMTGYPLPFGTAMIEGALNFSTVVPVGKECRLLLYRLGRTKPEMVFEMPESEAAGEVRFIALKGLNPDEYEYNYQIDDKIVVDTFAKALSGRNTFNETLDIQNHEIRGKIWLDDYEWEGDTPLYIPYNDVIAYSLHVRGFTKHSSSKVKHKGTFMGVIEKLPYLKELGINQIQCMPVYDFKEHPMYTNYWGYGPGYFFAPKGSYAAFGDAVKELKDMVKACHKAGVEVVLELPFTKDTDFWMVQDCIRYYMMEYHIDGVILDPANICINEIIKDPILKKIKIMHKQDGFQCVMRRFLKGDEGMVESVIWWSRHHSKEDRIFNYITDHNGFTLNDVVSYDGKHNEMNGENNKDGPDYNFSWNCGAEGPSRKRSIVKLRKKQMYNAFFLLLMAQGTPCILAGDEFANTQKGNNNVYCQDNETAWLDYRRLENHRDLFEYVKSLIVFRKEHPILHQAEELLGMDQICCGVPDVSYHGENAWRVPSEVASRQLGIYYSGEGSKDDDCFIAYNMHWLKHEFALPALSKGKKWFKVISTETGVFKTPELLEMQKEVEVPPRTIIMFIGRKSK